jgi:signal transduction histidine kinase
MKDTEVTALTQHATSFDELMLALLVVQMRRVPLAQFLASCVVVTIMYKHATPVMLIGWILLSLGSQSINWFLPPRLTSRPDVAASRRLEIVAAANVFDGTVTALPLLVFPTMPPFERAVLSMLLVGLSVGALASTAAHRRIFLSYITPFLAPLPFFWAFCSGFDNVWAQYVMAVVLAVFPFVLDGLSKDMNTVLHESFDIRLENAELNRELKVSLESAQNARAAAESASHAKTRFLASASHDLRQPIQTLSLFGAALSMRPLDDRSRAIAANMNTALHDLTGELDALLDVSKLDAGVVKSQPTKIRLSALSERIRGSFATAANDKRLELKILCPPEAWTITDKTHLERILRNLVENAIKYTDTGTITMEVRPEGNDHLLSIIDTGCGISTAEQARVFEEFYQVNNPERDRTRGLGLGLSIVKRLATMLNIPLALSSTPKLGTRVSLTLPVAEPDIQSVTLPLPQEQSIRTLHILAIDDEESVRLGMKALLTELGCTVSLGASTSEAVAEARLQAPDILLTDLRLRGTDSGISTIRAVRELYPNLPALIISGDSSPDKMLEAQAAGIAVIHKPVSSTILVAEIAKLVTAGDDD